jgi:hypothetical protein
VQNISPWAKVYLFLSKLESVQDLFSIPMIVAEALAVEERRKTLTTATQPGGASRSVAMSMVVAGSSTDVASRRVRCWGCGTWGHFQRNC